MSTAASPAPKKIPVRTPTQLALRRFRKSKLAMAGLAVLAVLYLASIFAGFLAPYGETRTNKKYSLAPPVATHFKFTRPDGRFSLRPWFYPLQTKRDLKTGENKIVELTDNPQEIVFGVTYSGDEYKDDSYRLLGIHRSNYHLLGTRPLALADKPAEGRVAEPLFLLGSDILGRDIWSRILFGSQISLTIGLVGIAISFTLGILIGGLSGLYGGWIDETIQRVGEVFMSIPSLYLILAVQAVAVQSVQHRIAKIHADDAYAAAHPVSRWLVNRFHIGEQLDARMIYLMIIIILALVGWAGVARVVRGIVLSLRELDYVTAARAMGARDLRIVISHLLPGTTTFLIIQATLSIPYYILSEVVLSFLGVGIKEPAASWGTMLTGARQMNVLLKAPWLLLPGAAIFVTVMAYNLLGDGLRDALDPKQKIK